MKIRSAELRRIALNMSEPFVTAGAQVTTRELLILRLASSPHEGWGECSVLSGTSYSDALIDQEASWLREHLIPHLLGAQLSEEQDLETLVLREFATSELQGDHPYAVAALEMALLDLALQQQRSSLAAYLGAERETVAAVAVIGIKRSIEDLVIAVESKLGAGYRAIKLKVQPGWDSEPLKAVGEVLPDDILLMVDANGSYDPKDMAGVAALDRFGLSMVEQPFGTEDLGSHAELRRRMVTPVALDESVASMLAAREAMQARACDIICVKPGRFGGLLAGKALRDECREQGVSVRLGGMLESGLARTANLSLAALPGFLDEAEVSPPTDHFAEDIVAPITMHLGRLKVPKRAGIGVCPDLELLDAVTVSSETFEA